MQTYSHGLITAVLGRKLSRGKRVALLAGSVAPDVPLGLLSVGYVLDRRFVRPYLPDKTRCSPTYNDLYFNNPWWIAAYNSLHAPLPLLVLGLIGYCWRRTGWGNWLFWFVMGCAGHTAIDIFTHADDGPVVAFPLDWRTRFRSPISYWDATHHGRTFRLLEHLLDVLLMTYLLWKR